MEIQQLTGVSHTLQTVAIASLIIAVIAYLPKLNFTAQLLKLPALAYDNGRKRRKTYIDHAVKLYADGYQQFKDKVYRMATDDGVDNVVIPPKFLPEIRALPDSVVSFPAFTSDFMFSKYTGLDTYETMSIHVVRADLTPGLIRLNHTISDEIERATAEEMPPCEDWTELGIYMKLVRIVAKTSGRLFVGPELCRNDDYLDAAIWYTLEMFGASRKVHKMNPWLRPVLAPRLSEIQKVQEKEKKAVRLIAPVVQARREAAKDPDYQEPDDALQWLMKRAPHYSVEKLAKVQLALIMAAIHTTSMMATSIIFTLAATPEYIDPLRDEIRTVRAEHNGELTFRALQQLEKLDSYMKEVVRFYPMATAGMSRKVLQGFTLSNGQHIPAGTTIEAASREIYRDPVNYPDSETFDGFRSYKIRQQAGNHARNQFVSSNEQNLQFGYGKHACPGRFFAANEIKLILVGLIMDYDFKNVDGTTERYPDKPSGRVFQPDVARKLLFKKAVI